MAYPVVRNRTETQLAAGTTLTCNFGTNVAGDLCIIFIALNDTAQTITTTESFTNWTNTSATFHVIYKVLDGTEGTSTAVTVGTSTKGAAIAYTIEAGTFASGIAPAISTVATGTSTAPNATACSPTGSAKDYLWISAFRQNGEEADDDTWCTSAPTTPGTFTNLLQKTSGTASTAPTNGSLASAEYQANATSVDAGAFTVAQSLAWRAYTVAVYPIQTGSFTANAVIKGTVSGSFTANGVVKKTQTGSFTANAVILAPSGTKTFTANAVIKKTISPGVTISKFYLHDASTSSLEGLPTSQVSSTQVSTTATGANVNRDADSSVGSLQVASPAGGGHVDLEFARRFISVQLPGQSLSGTFSFGGTISQSATPEASPGVQVDISLWRIGTGKVADVQSYSSSSATETSSPVWHSFTSGSFSGVAVEADDILIFEIFTYSTAITNASSQFYYDGATEGSTTDAASYVSFSNPVVLTPALTADALIAEGGGTKTGHFHPDAVILANSGTKTFTADAIRRVSSGTLTFSASAILRATVTPSGGFKADAVRRATITPTGSKADAIIQRPSGTLTFTASAILLASSGTKTFTSSSIRRATVTPTGFTASAVIQKTINSANNFWTITRTHTIGGTVRDTSWMYDALVYEGDLIHLTISASSYGGSWWTRGHFLDTVPSGPTDYGYDGWNGDTSGYDADLTLSTFIAEGARVYVGLYIWWDANNAATMTVRRITAGPSSPPLVTGPTLDAWIAKTQSGSFSASAILRKTVEPTFSASAVILASSGTKTFTADAVLLKSSGTKTFTASAVILASSGTKTFSAAAIARREQAGSLSASAISRKTQATSFSADALIVVLVWKDTFDNRVTDYPDIGSPSDVGFPYTTVKGGGYVWKSGAAFLDANSEFEGGGGLSAGLIQFDYIVTSAASRIEIHTGGGSLRLEHPTGPRLVAYGSGAQAFIDFNPTPGDVWRLKGWFGPLSFGDRTTRVKAWKVGEAEPDWQDTKTAYWSPASMPRYGIQTKATTALDYIDSVYVWAVEYPLWKFASFTANATIKREQTGSFSANAVLRKTQSNSFTASAVIGKTQLGSFSASAIAKGTQSSSFAANAVTLRTFHGLRESHYTHNDSHFEIYGTREAAQTFLSATNDGITHVDVGVHTGGTPPNPLTVGIYATSGVEPTGSALVTGTLAVANVGTTDGLVYRVTLANEIRLTKNTLYAIVLSTSGGDANNTWHWNFDSTSADYPNGDKLTKIGPVWTEFPTHDFLFGVLGPCWFTADASIRRGGSGTIAADAVLLASSGTKTFTASAIARRVQAGSFSASAIIQRAQTNSFSASAIARRTMPPASITVTTIQDGGPSQHEIQRATVNAGGGQFSLFLVMVATFGPLDWNCSAAAMVAEFAAKGKTVAVTKAGGVYTIEFLDNIDYDTMGADGSNLIDGAAAYLDAVILASSGTKTFTADAVRLAPSGTKTFSADALILASSGTKTITASAILFASSGTKTFSADAEILGASTIVGSFSAAAVAKRELTGSLTGDAVVRRTSSAPLLLDAIIRRSGSASLTTSAIVLRTQVGSFAAAAAIRREQTGVLYASSILQRTQAGAFAASAVIRATQSGASSASAVIQRTQAGSFSGEAVVRQTALGMSRLDAVLSRGSTGSLTTDAIVLAVVNKTATADAVFKATSTGAFTTGAVVRRTTSSPLSIDAVLLRVAAASLTTDAIVRRSIEGSFGAEAQITASPTASITASAVIKGTQEGSFTAAAVRSVTATWSFAAEALIRRPYTFGFAAEAELAQGYTTRSGSATADAVIRSTGTGATTLDAWITSSGFGYFDAKATIKATLQGTFSASAIRITTQAGSFGASSVLRATASASFTAASIRSATIGGSSTANSVLKATISGSFTAQSVARKTYGGQFSAESQIVLAAVYAFTASAVVTRTHSATLTASSVLRTTGQGSFTAAALQLKRAEASIGAAALLLATRTGGLAAQAVLRAQRERTFDAAAYLIRWDQVTGSLAADAVIVPRRDFTADAVIAGSSERTFRLDAVIVGLRAPFTATVSADLLDHTESAAMMEASTTAAMIEAMHYPPEARQMSLTIDAVIA